MKKLLMLAILVPEFAYCETPQWQNFNKEENVKKLTKLEYSVTQENATERAFHNKYWHNHQEGIYVDIVSDEPLFSSTDKYQSGTGWPSFSKPIDKKSIQIKPRFQIELQRF